MASTDHDFLFKVVIIGDSGAGKSCLLLKFCDGEFSDTFISTIGVDFKFKNVVSHNKTCKLQIWDTGMTIQFLSLILKLDKINSDRLPETFTEGLMVLSSYSILQIEAPFKEFKLGWMK